MNRSTACIPNKTNTWYKASSHLICTSSFDCCEKCQNPATLARVTTKTTGSFLEKLISNSFQLLSMSDFATQCDSVLRASASLISAQKYFSSKNNRQMNYICTASQRLRPAAPMHYNQPHSVAATNRKTNFRLMTIVLPNLKCGEYRSGRCR